jgi:hypothetical protein
VKTRIVSDPTQGSYDLHGAARAWGYPVDVIATWNALKRIPGVVIGPDGKPRIPGSVVEGNRPHPSGTGFSEPDSFDYLGIGPT